MEYQSYLSYRHIGGTKRNLNCSEAALLNFVVLTSKFLSKTLVIVVVDQGVDYYIAYLSKLELKYEI